MKAVIQIVFFVLCLRAPVCFCQEPEGVVRQKLYGILNKASLSSDGVLRLGPDPNAYEQIVVLLIDPQIRTAVGVDPSQANAVNTLVETLAKEWQKEAKQHWGTKEGFAYLDELTKKHHEALRVALEEILTPEELKRLSQLAWRIEIDGLGWPIALTKGGLASEIGIYEDQKDVLYRKMKHIEAELEKEIANAKKKAEEAVLSELTPEQRRKTTSLIGDFFNYRSASQSQDSRNAVLKMLEQKEMASPLAKE